MNLINFKPPNMKSKATYSKQLNNAYYWQLRDIVERYVYRQVHLFKPEFYELLKSIKGKLGVPGDITTVDNIGEGQVLELDRDELIALDAAFSPFYTVDSYDKATYSITEDTEIQRKIQRAIKAEQPKGHFRLTTKN